MDHKLWCLRIDCLTIPAFKTYLENWVWLDTYLEPNVSFDTLIRSRDVPKSYFKLNKFLDKSLATVSSLSLIKVRT